MRLVLASTSPRRAELLTAAGVQFTVQPVNADETAHEGERPEAYVRRIALAKAVAAGEPPPHTVVLTADTAVTIDGLLLGKPRDERDAARMLTRLSSRTHRVLTAIVLSHTAGRMEDLAVTNVTFHPLSPETVSWYLASGEPYDKAGAYAIQGLASRFVARIEGSYSNVVGLPVDLVCRHLEMLAPALLAGVHADQAAEQSLEQAGEHLVDHPGERAASSPQGTPEGPSGHPFEALPGNAS